ncbi:hypothetical protein [Mycobacteroides abscessus]|uniref:hypothetical protein n=1 Tax=Mycobacteroides abscessus TaxID=36809 RepID=UPI000C262162|nr:hypothetical protein [Mycobacteroides abscessus]
MNSDIKDIADWAASQGWTVDDTTSGYTQFYDPQGNYVGRYPATPSRPYRRMLDLTVALKKAGLELPPPSKKEQASRRRKAKGQGQISTKGESKEDDR